MQFDTRMGLMIEFYKFGYISNGSQEKTLTNLLTDQDQ